MPRVTKKHMDDRRMQILDAAIACFARHGAQGTTMKHICERAGLSAGAVYLHFKNKQDIIDSAFELGRRGQRELADQLGEADGLTALDHMLTAYFEPLDSPKGAERARASVALIAEGLRNARIREQYLEQTGAVTALLARAASELAETGRADRGLDPEMAAEVLFCVFEGFRVRKLMNPGLDTMAFVEAFRALL